MISSFQNISLVSDNSPAEDAEYEVEHEEGADHDERDEEDPVERAPDRIVRLEDKKKMK